MTAWQAGMRALHKGRPRP